MISPHLPEDEESSILPILGLVTLGQGPRPDLEIEFRRHVTAAELLIVGALDGYSRGEVQELAAIPGDYPLLVRLSDGVTAEIQRAVLAPLVELRARQLAMAGARLVVVVCAGAFPDIDCTSAVLLPGRILPAIVSAVCRTRRIGIVTPIAGQMPAARDKWTSDGFDVEVTYAAPFRHDEIRQAANIMADSDLELVVLDCMGYSPATRREFARHCTRPALLAQSLVARVAGELIER